MHEGPSPQTLEERLILPVPEDYKKAIEEIRFQARTDPYSNQLASQVVGGDYIAEHEMPIYVGNEIETRGLTKMGDLLKRVMRDRDFIDLGCGETGLSRVPRDLAELFGAKGYIGVDKFWDIYDPILPREKAIEVCSSNGHYNLMNTPGPIYSKEGRNDFMLEWVQDDLLGFLSKLDQLDGAVFNIAGIEPLNRDSTTVLAYTQALEKEINRLSKKGDALLMSIGVNMPLKPENIGFKKVESDEINVYKIYIKE